MARSDTAPKSLAAAQKALALAPQLAAAHLALANGPYEDNWEWAKAEAEFKKALELDPSLARGHDWYGLFLSALGRHQEAIAHTQRAVDLEPFNLHFNGDLALAFWRARMYDRALEQNKKTVELDPSFAGGHDGLSGTYYTLKRYDEWLAEWRQAASLYKVPESIALQEAAARGYAKGGIHGALAAELDESLKQHARGIYVDPADIAWLYATLGEKEQMFRWLETALAEKSGHLFYMKAFPEYDPYRSEPRFRAILAKMGLPE